MKAGRFSRAAWPLAMAFVMMIASGCPDIEDENEKERQREEALIKADADYDAKVALRKDYMEVFYYWRDQVIERNSTFKPYNYDIYDFFDIMLYNEDRWSWMCDKDEYITTETGVISGTWGVSIGQAIEYYNDYGIRIRYIFPGSPFAAYGVTRGSLLTAINGFNVSDDGAGFTSEKLKYFQENFYKSPQTFTFRQPDGTECTFTCSMLDKLETRPSLVSKIITPDEFKGLPSSVGYFHYLAFKAGFLSEINTVMRNFRDNGIRNLIIDLRYNGGGDSRASQLMVDYLAPRSAVGEPYVIRRHNRYLASISEYYSDENNTYCIEGNSSSLDLDRLYFIVGSGSASASEMVINGLKPYYGDKLQMVGDTTYGKPNGMYVLMYPGSEADYEAYNRDDFTKLKWVFFPISFFNENSRGEKIPLNGFAPDLYRPDDLFHDFVVGESSIDACLTHIATGSYPSAIPGKGSKGGNTKAEGGASVRIKTETDRPGYGLDVVNRPPKTVF